MLINRHQLNEWREETEEIIKEAHKQRYNELRDSFIPDYDVNDIISPSGVSGDYGLFHYHLNIEAMPDWWSRNYGID